MAAPDSTAPPPIKRERKDVSEEDNVNDDDVQCLSYVKVTSNMSNEDLEPLLSGGRTAFRPEGSSSVTADHLEQQGTTGGRSNAAFGDGLLLQEASKEEIDAWLVSNIEAREKSKIPSEELRSTCALGLGKTFSSRRFGEAIRAAFPNVRLNNKGRANPDQPIISFYYGVAYKGEEHLQNSILYQKSEDFGVLQVASTPSTGNHSNEMYFSSSTTNTQDGDLNFSESSSLPLIVDTVSTNITKNTHGCPSCTVKDKQLARVRTKCSSLEFQVEDLAMSLEAANRERDALKKQVIEYEGKMKQLEEKVLDMRKKIDIVQKVLSM